MRVTCRRIVLVSNTAWSIVNFRAGLIRAIVGKGFEVIAIAQPDNFESRLGEMGCTYVPLRMDNTGINPLRDLGLLLSFRRIFADLRPDCVLAFTIKPNIYGALAAHSLSIPVVNNINGLGTVFIKRDWITRVAMRLYRAALKSSRRVFFQNDNDLRLFLDAGLIQKHQTALLPGSGVDTDYFHPRMPSIPERRGGRFLLIARMLWDKGVGEYVAAARVLRERHPDWEFALLGFLDVANKRAISRTQMNEWVSAGWISYLGETNDVRPFIAEADCIVLPSYREGTPRSLLEASSMAKPIIATDAVGCREVVEDGVNGFLANVRDSVDLAEKMERMLSLPRQNRVEMGRRGREKVIREFDEKIVIESYLAEIRAMASQGT